MVLKINRELTDWFLSYRNSMLSARYDLICKYYFSGVSDYSCGADVQN
jgi:hypothetical protein